MRVPAKKEAQREGERLVAICDPTLMAMTCSETILVMYEFLENRLSAPEALGVQCHLSLCPNCRLVHEAARRTLQSASDVDIVPGRASRVIKLL